MNMNNQDFTTTIVVEQTAEEAFNTILNVSFLAGGGVHYTKQKLVELLPDKKVVWLVTDANLSFVDKTDEWKGTKISFEIFEENNKTRIVFTHIGLVPEFECYDSCAPAWTQYVQQRLTHALNKTNEENVHKSA